MNQNNAGWRDIVKRPAPFRKAKLKVKTTPFTITTKPPHYPWPEHGKIIQELTHLNAGLILHKAIDDNLIIDEDGKWYYFWGNQLWEEEDLAHVKMIASTYLQAVGREYIKHLEEAKTSLEDNKKADIRAIIIRMDRPISRLESIATGINQITMEINLCDPEDEATRQNLIRERKTLRTFLTETWEDLESLHEEWKKSVYSEEIPGSLGEYNRKDQEISKYLSEAYAFMRQVQDCRFITRVLELNSLDFRVKNFRAGRPPKYMTEEKREAHCEYPKRWRESHPDKVKEGNHDRMQKHNVRKQGPLNRIAQVEARKRIIVIRKPQEL